MIGLGQERWLGVVGLRPSCYQPTARDITSAQARRIEWVAMLEHTLEWITPVMFPCRRHVGAVAGLC